MFFYSVSYWGLHSIESTLKRMHLTIIGISILQFDFVDFAYFYNKNILYYLDSRKAKFSLKREKEKNDQKASENDECHYRKVPSTDAR